MQQPDFNPIFAGVYPTPYPTCIPLGVPPPSTRDTNPGSRPGHVPGALLKKKRESYAIALPPSFSGTDKPHHWVDQTGGGR